MERRDGLHPPRLPLRALGLRPDDRLVVGGEDQEAPRADLDPVAARLVGVEEERLLDRVLVRARLHHDPVLEEDVGRAEHVLALVDEEGDVMEPAARPRQVARVGDVVGLLVGREPDPGLGAVVEHDLLGQPQAEVVLEEDAVLGGIDGEEVDVVEVAHADAAPRVALRLVLERRPKLRRRLVALGLVEELEPVAVGIEEAVGGAVTEVAVEPLALDAGRLERGDPALAAPRGCASGRRGARRPACVGRGQLHRRPLVVAEAAQVHRVAALARDLHPEDLP